jgi:small subunit ribosomal protein S10
MQQICITLKSFDPQCLTIAMKHIINIARLLEIKTIKKIELPQKIKKITVIRSPHIDKKSREQFEIRHHKCVFILNIEKRLCAVLFFECLKNSQISGVELSIDVCSTSFYSIS